MPGVVLLKVHPVKWTRNVKMYGPPLLLKGSPRKKKNRLTKNVQDRVNIIISYYLFNYESFVIK